MSQTYVERPPVPALSGLVRVVWVQRIGSAPYAQRNLPTGGAELHCVVGSVPRLIGPLTRARVEVFAPGTVVVGVRFRPGVALQMLGLPGSELIDQRLDLDEVWGPAGIVLGELVAGAESPEAALGIVQEHLVGRRYRGPEPDALVLELVRRLMPWRDGGVGLLSSRLAISPSQLRRRCLAAVGIGPKALQRTLRFQGFLALVQAARVAAPSARDGLAALAAESGYADHAHLSRECLRLAGLPPRAFLNDAVGRCTCGHDHSASYLPILRARPRVAAIAA